MIVFDLLSASDEKSSNNNNNNRRWVGRRFEISLETENCCWIDLFSIKREEVIVRRPSNSPWTTINLADGTDDG